MDNSVTEEQFNKAKETIKKYEDQMNEERTTYFRQQLEQYNNTFWKYKKHFQTIYMSARLDERSLFVTQFIINTNGILEVKATWFDKTRFESYLKTLSEYEYNETFDRVGKEENLFEKISEEEFLNQINCGILLKLKISDDYVITTKYIKGE